VRVGLLLAALAVLVAGCGGSHPSTQSVVRAWSQALNAEDNKGAADLFAPGAEVVQGPNVTHLRTHAEAEAWNSALPCSGRIVSIKSHGATVRATFVLGDRQHSRCDGPGQRATAIFRVVKGKIVLWHQAETSALVLPAPPTSSA
jgi:limonene-1,2-epoxide hydrolase